MHGLYIYIYHISQFGAKFLSVGNLFAHIRSPTVDGRSDPAKGHLGYIHSPVCIYIYTIPLD